MLENRRVRPVFSSLLLVGLLAVASCVDPGDVVGGLGGIGPGGGNGGAAGGGTPGGGGGGTAGAPGGADAGGGVMTGEVGEGESCGGFRAGPLRTCGKGLRCNDPPGKCGAQAVDGPGICEAVPTVCTKELRPVCGCDGKTYGNDCMRKSAGVALNHEGECRAGGPGPGPGPRKEGEMCGGIAGFACEKGLFCEHPAGMCRVADGAGVCKRTPQACDASFRPVCGCDGKTYGNDCARQLAGVAKDRDGECGGGQQPVIVGEGELCGGFRIPPQRVCAMGLKCNDQPGKCGSQAADAPGICEAVPAACTREFKPVCGCDGKTYGNDCMRKSAGVSLNHAGECSTRGGRGEGEMCGGIAGFTCAAGLFCEHGAGTCRVADGAGVCKRTPQACDTALRPVCGCDGKTYGNDCARQLAGVIKDHDGECAPAPARLLSPGMWGGEHAVLNAADPRAGATIEFDCARGTIQGPLAVQADGTFKWPGKFVREGGPEPAGGRPSVDATYYGSATPMLMELVVALNTGGGEARVPFKLAHGAMGRLIKCQ